MPTSSASTPDANSGRRVSRRVVRAQGAPPSDSPDVVFVADPLPDRAATQSLEQVPISRTRREKKEARKAASSDRKSQRKRVPKHGPLLAIVSAAALVSALLAAVSGTLWARENDKAEQLRDDRVVRAIDREEYLNFAAKVTNNLLTISEATLDEDVDKVVADIEGDFYDQFAPRRDSYEEIVKLTEINATGDVVAAATEEMDSKHAVTLLAVNQSLVKLDNKEAKADQRLYRMRVTVNRKEDGTLKVSNVDFIP